MRILLVNPARFAKDSYILPPMHLLYIAQAIRRAGHEAEILDLPYLMATQPEKYRIGDGSLFELVFSKPFDVLGIGSVVSSYFFCEQLVQELRRRRPGVPVIVGGSVGLPIREVWEQNSPADYLCESDGELVAEEFVKNYPHAMETLRNVPGLYHLDQNGKYEGVKYQLSKDLDPIPFLTFDEIDIEYYIDNQRKWIKNVLGDSYQFDEKTRFLPLIMSRGCVYRCTFCFHFHHMHRRHSPKYIADYLEFLMSRYGATAFQIIDDLIMINKEWLHGVCDEVLRRGLKVSFFSSGGKPSIVDREILEKMKRAGFKRISYGVESGSQTILDVMQKQTTVANNQKAISLTREAGIPTSVNIVFGMPKESARTMDETRDFLISLDLTSKDYYAALATPYPGSPLFKYALDKGIVPNTREYLLNLGGYGDYKYNLTDMSKPDFLRHVKEVAFQVDLAYLRRRGLHGRIAKLILVKYLRQAYDSLPPGVRVVVRAGARRVLGLP